MKIVIFSIIIIIFSQISKSQIVINEICASNFRNFYDEDNDDPDWIELYNSSDKAVNLKGWKIFDKNEIENAFVLPDTILQAKERIVIFASGKNRYTSNKLYVETTGMGIAGHLKDEIFHFKYLPVSNDFEIELQFDKILSDKRYAGAGLMFKEKLDSKSKFISIISHNKESNLNSILNKFDIDSIPKLTLRRKSEFDKTILKMTKLGNQVITEAISTNGIHFQDQIIDTISFTEGFFGLCFAANDINNNNIDTFLVSNLKINKKEFDFNKLLSIDLYNFDGKSTSFINKEIHSNFKISKSEEEIFLWNSKGQIVDKVTIKNQKTNYSFSRFPDASDNYFYSEATPNKKNLGNYTKIIDPPTFSEKSTIGRKLDKIEIYYNNPNAEIYYTLDGSEPTKNSYFYQNQISLDTAVIIRAKAFLDDALCFEDAVFTYNPLYNSGLPYISLITDTNNLYYSYNGIININNLYLDLETKVYFDYIDNDINFKTLAGIRLHGGGTRFFYPQKSFRLYPRYEKNDDFNFSFWDQNKSIFTNKLILKNGGQDWIRTFIRDNFFNLLSNKYLTNLEKVNTSISLTYINNEYYGITNFKERVDEEYLSNKYDLESSENINLKMRNSIKSGKFVSLYNLIDSIKLSDEKTKMTLIYENFDIDNVINYTFLNLYAANDDWPDYNELIWSSPEHDSKWRWIPNDFDISMSRSYNSLFYTNTIRRILDSNSEYCDVFKVLFNDNQFRVQFANFSADMLNTKFKSSNILNDYDSLINIIRPLIDIQKNKYKESLIDFEFYVEEAHTFINKRAYYIYKHFKSYLSPTGTTQINLSQNIKNAGVFYLNTIKISDSTWTGEYYNEIPISISVKSNPGFSFIGWKNFENSDSVLTNIYITDISNFYAIFEKNNKEINDLQNNIVINEIMYKAKNNMNCGDWIELYNNNTFDIDISNWILKDNNEENTFVFPENTIINGKSFLIIAQNVFAFQSEYKIYKDVIGGFEFGFGKTDEVRLFDYNYNLIDKVSYSNQSPWNQNSDGTGSSLELINPELDNSIYINWIASQTLNGSPLKINSTSTKVTELGRGIKTYPNPFKDNINIEIDINDNLNVSIYDLLGNEVYSKQLYGKHLLLSDLHFNSGKYLIVIRDNNMNILFKDIIIKK
jgi:hypothetical protein